MRVRALRSTARARMSKVAAVAGLSGNFDRQKSFVTAVLAATGRNLLSCGSSAVADGTSYCCRSAVKEIGIRGGEHSSGRQGVSINLWRISVAATTLDLTPKQRIR